MTSHREPNRKKRAPALDRELITDEWDTLTLGEWQAREVTPLPRAAPRFHRYADNL